PPKAPQTPPVAPVETSETVTPEYNTSFNF
ncbi:unnamed protein product, partial [marine sediment metagenome]